MFLSRYSERFALFDFVLINSFVVAYQQCVCAHTHTCMMCTGNATMSRGRHLIALSLSLALSTVNCRIACDVVVNSAHCTNSAMVNCFWRPAVCNTLASNMLHAVVGCIYLALPFPRQSAKNDYKKKTRIFVCTTKNKFLHKSVLHLHNLIVLCVCSCVCAAFIWQIGVRFRHNE